MKLSIDVKTSLTQTLTPQQIHYLKLLQLPLVQLEQQLRQEIDMNPMLDEFEDEIIEQPNDEPIIDSNSDAEFLPEEDVISEEKPESMIDDERDPFEFHNMLWQDDSEYMPVTSNYSKDDEDNDYFQIKDTTSVIDELNNQLKLFPLSKEELLLGNQIIGNIDGDGYLRRDLKEIVDETNSLIAEHNFNIQKELYELANSNNITANGDNPALKFALNQESIETLKRNILLSGKEYRVEFKNGYHKDSPHKVDANHTILKQINLDTAEKMLTIIRQLEPQGMGSRSIQECLLAQCEFLPNKTKQQAIAVEILKETYDSFAKKHYDKIKKDLFIGDDELRSAIDYIKTLNPKPGGDDFQSETNVVIPDFSIDIDVETEELLISINDSRMPVLKLNKAYENLKKEARARAFNKETKQWIRDKYEEAKFLIQAIKQRKNTMLKVMTAIAHLQKGFFYEGSSALKPLIYKDVAEETALDISTVCRIVNNKYVQTRFGTFELKYFFSESLPSDEGEEISTTVIKQTLKNIIEAESKSKPYSDDELSKMLKEKGYNVARRTVAKYREQLKLPVARLRKEF